MAAGPDGELAAITGIGIHSGSERVHDRRNIFGAPRRRNARWPDAAFLRGEIGSERGRVGFVAWESDPAWEQERQDGTLCERKRRK